MLVLANDRTTRLDAREPTDDLWIRTDRMEEATGWTLKPQGACFGELCVPLNDAERREWVHETEDGTWFDVSTLAAKVGQKIVRDGDVWSLGTVPLARKTTLESGIAPDFRMTDRTGREVCLSDFRGRKVLLVTWASW